MRLLDGWLTHRDCGRAQTVLPEAHLAALLGYPSTRPASHEENKYAFQRRGLPVYEGGPMKERNPSSLGNTDRLPKHLATTQASGRRQTTPAPWGGAK
jgi:hypothetical protein